MSTFTEEHGYVVRIADSRLDIEEDLRVPPSVIVETDEPGAHIMLGESPVDGRLVIHIDGWIGQDEGQIARIYLNDHLIVGEEKE